jgi:pilus assembly protein TadC
VVGSHYQWGIDMIWAAVFLAAALLSAGAPRRVARRAGLDPSVAATVRDSAEPADPLAVASTLDVFAACLSSGMAVASAAAATAPSAPQPLAAVLGRAAELLALGADAATAWSSVGPSSDRHVEALTRLARRSAASGAALARGVADLADQSRQDAGDAASAAGERASVLIAGPLGLCYLPAFLCLGVVPVVMGLARDVLDMGVL